MIRESTVLSAFLFLLFFPLLLFGQDEVPTLLDDVVYFAFGSDHEGERERKNYADFDSEAVYIIPVEPPPAAREDMLKSSTRISRLGGCRQPAWNKQGNRLAYFDGSAGFENSKIVIVDFADKSRRELDTTPPTSAGISWNADGDKLVYVGRDSGICIYDTEGHTERVVFKNPASESISISPDGEWIVFMTRDGDKPNDADGWRLNLFNVESEKLHSAGTISDHFGVVGPFAWTSDSKNIATRRFKLVEGGGRQYHNSMFEIETLAFNEVQQIPDNIVGQDLRFWRNPEQDNK